MAAVCCYFWFLLLVLGIQQYHLLSLTIDRPLVHVYAEILTKDGKYLALLSVEICRSFTGL